MTSPRQSTSGGNGTGIVRTKRLRKIDPSAVVLALLMAWPAGGSADGFDTVLRGLALELEVTRSVSPGTVVGSDLEVESQGLYVAWRSAGTVYVKGRLGLVDASLTGTLAEGEGGETFGAALGWRRSWGAIELDYTSIDDDIAFISAGVIYRPAL